MVVLATVGLAAVVVVAEGLVVEVDLVVLLAAVVVEVEVVELVEVLNGFVVVFLADVKSLVDLAKDESLVVVDLVA